MKMHSKPRPVSRRSCTAKKLDPFNEQSVLNFWDPPRRVMWKDLGLEIDSLEYNKYICRASAALLKVMTTSKRDIAGPEASRLFGILFDAILWGEWVKAYYKKRGEL